MSDFILVDPSTNEVIAPEGMNNLTPGQIIHIQIPAINNSWVNDIPADCIAIKVDIPGFELVEFYENENFTCVQRKVGDGLGYNQLVFFQPHAMPADDYELCEVDIRALNETGTGNITSNVIVMDVTKISDFNHRNNSASVQYTIV